MLWLVDHQRREPQPDGARTERLAAHEMALLLAVPAINQALRDELDELGLELPRSDTGYHELHIAAIPLVIIDLGAVAEREDDDVLRWFAGLPLHTLAAQRWVRQHRSTEPGSMSTSATPDLEGYEEFVTSMMAEFSPKERLAGLAPEQIVAALAPEQIVAALAPEQRLAGLSEAEQVLALPATMLRALSDEYVATLPDDVQAKVRARRAS